MLLTKCCLVIKLRRVSGCVMWHIRVENTHTHTYIYRYMGFWWVNLWERDHLEDLGIDGRVMLTFILWTFNSVFGLLLQSFSTMAL
jgi:isocitrate dehydrogenase kinase/phosphatase